MPSIEKEHHLPNISKPPFFWGWTSRFWKVYMSYIKPCDHRFSPWCHARIYPPARQDASVFVSEDLLASGVAEMWKRSSTRARPCLRWSGWGVAACLRSKFEVKFMMVLSLPFVKFIYWFQFFFDAFFWGGWENRLIFGRACFLFHNQKEKNNDMSCFNIIEVLSCWTYHWSIVSKQTNTWQRLLDMKKTRLFPIMIFYSTSNENHQTLKQLTTKKFREDSLQILVKQNQLFVLLWKNLTNKEPKDSRWNMAARSLV